MIKIDNITYILKDGSILNFYDDGLVKEQAILVWNEIDKQLKNVL